MSLTFLENEKALTIVETLRSPSPTFRQIKLAGEEFQLASFLIEKTKAFIQLNYPSADARLVSKEFCRTILHSKPEWKEKEILTFLQWVMDNATDERLKVYGGTFVMTLIKLLEFVSYYEQDKAAERESIIYEKKEEYKTVDQATPEAVKSFVQEILNKVNACKIPAPIVSIKKALFDPIWNDLDYEVFKGMIPEMTKEVKQKWLEEIFTFHSTHPRAIFRREKLLALLK